MSAMPPTDCPLCGSNRYMNKRKELYGHYVCKKCNTKFANRRQFAWLIDMIGFRIFAVFVGAAFGVAAAMAEVSEDGITALGFLLRLAILPLFMIKDGFAGQSPGKMLMGVRAIDETTGQPIGLGTSLKRNLSIIIPFMPLVMAVQMMKGPRMGDRWANTRVIWNKYATSPVFRVGTVPIEQVSAAALQASLQKLPAASENPFEAPPA